ncbi:MAG TPA: penicillin-binding protein 1C [Gemmatimonadaceae bacterium]|nr:penicillin-binding protein 1C [Gemmatimonadaceae bacterium]
MRLARRVLFGAAVSLGTAVLAAAAWIAWPLPEDLVSREPVPAVRLEDRHGLALRTTRAEDGSRVRWMSLAEIDPDLIAAFVAVEDRRFYEHPGVDPRAVARAVRDNLQAGRVVSGASTISMQTARLLRPTSRRWTGKLTQALWALRLERHLGKQEILEQYLNRVHLGQGTVGVGAAAALYYGSSAADVSLAQAATLAGIAHAPSSENPLASSRRARRRRQHALAAIQRSGYADAAAVALAQSEAIAARVVAPDFLAPHFTTRALRWMSDSGQREQRVRTSIDLPLQQALEREVRHTVRVLADRGVHQAALVVLDNRRGEILAWVGSPDFWSDTAGQTDMVVSARQPGSTLKPFLYGLAFERGYTAASVLADVPRTYLTPTGPYRPRNYDHRFHGPVRVREALASSYNVPAVALAEQIGAGSLLETLRQAGFASLARSAEHYGLGLSLGNGDVTLLELANAYRALANGGVWRPYRWRASSAGTPDTGPSRRIMSGRSAALVLDILSDPEARIPGFGVATPFDFGFPVAVKTGTSRHFTDNWAVATTGAFTVAVWVGNFSGRPMEGVSGITGAGPLLQRAVLAVAARHPPGAFVTPRELGLRPVSICRLSGLRAVHGCAQVTEWFIPGTEPGRGCDWHGDGGVRLPAQYAEWVEQSRALGAPPAYGARPDGPTAPLDERFRIVSPREGDRYDVPPGVDASFATIGLRAAGGTSGAGVRWLVDGRAARGTRLPLTPGEHVIRAEGRAGEVDSVRIVVAKRSLR